MAVTQGKKVLLVDFIECIAHILEDIDPYILMPERNFGNYIVVPGRLFIRVYVDFNSGTLELHDLNFKVLRYDLSECVDYYDKDGKASYELLGNTVTISTKNKDQYIVHFGDSLT